MAKATVGYKQGKKEDLMEYGSNLIAENEKLRDLCAEMYQVIGVIMDYMYIKRDDALTDKLVPILDQLYAASAGEDLPKKSLLPFNLEG